MNAHDKEDWVQRVRAQLDIDSRDLDAASASRLNQARQQALDRGLRKSRRTHWAWYGLATSAVLLLALLLTGRTPPESGAVPTVAAQQAPDDFDLLAGAEDLELIENLEFYAWLEQQSLDG